MNVVSVPAATYRSALRRARNESQRIADSTSSPEEFAEECRFFITPDARSGFAVTPDGTAVGLFSQVKGRGDSLLRQAVGEGGRKLDCFDGFLPAYYAARGFVETDRVGNYVHGEPDVVFMAYVG